jgi:Fur family transcriptional regulator, ferric uptake regulator
MQRDTQQKEAIRLAFIRAGRPLSVEEILRYARNEVAGLGIATVYRNLKALQEEKFIKTVDLPGQTSRWEIAPDVHHHHFLCQTCGKLFEIHGCPADLSHLVPEGYILEEHDILLRGRCKNCNQLNNIKKR